MTEHQEGMDYKEGTELRSLETLLSEIGDRKRSGGTLDTLRQKNPVPEVDDRLVFCDFCYVKRRPSDGVVILSEKLLADSLTGRLTAGQRPPHAHETMKEHKYFWDGVMQAASVTGWIERLGPGFCTEKVSRRIVARAATWRDPNYKNSMQNEEFEMALAKDLKIAVTTGTPSDALMDAAQEILIERWRKIGEAAAARGSGVHMSCEMFYSDMFDQTIARFNETEFLQFLQFHVDVVQKHGWKPFRTEMPLYAARFGGLCGMVDMLYTDKDGSIVMADWKTNRKMDPAVKQMMHCPLEDLQSCKLTKFTIQLNTYALMLEEVAGEKYRPVEMCVVQFCDLNKSYRYYKIPDIRKRLKSMLLQRNSIEQYLSKKRKIDDSSKPLKLQKTE